MDFPNTKKKLSQGISSYMSSMKREKREHDFISDGAGKRYLLFVLYFLLEDLKKCQSYFDWYEKEFPDDAGEPVQILCWALLLKKMGMEEKAKHKLAELMLSNLYFIPKLMGKDIKKYSMWHSTNYEEPEYFGYTPPQIIEKVKNDEKIWMNNYYDSFEFKRIRKRYVEIYTKLPNEKDVEKRGTLINEASSLLDLLQSKVQLTLVETNK